MVTMPENGLLLPPSFPRVCRNLPNILAHWVCALGIFGWLLSAYVGSPRYLVSLTCCFLACCQGSRAFPVLQETHPLASEPQGLLNHTTSSADFFFSACYDGSPSKAMPCGDNDVSLPFWWRLLWWLWFARFPWALWVSDGFSIFSVSKFSVSLVRAWALEKASGFEDPRVLVPVS